MRLLLILILCGLCYADEKDDFNGRRWAKFDGLNKAVYVLGLSGGFEYGIALADCADDKLIAALSIPEFTIGDLVAEMDKLYLDRENILIPMPLLCVHVIRKLKGNSTKFELEESLIKLRKLYQNSGIVHSSGQ